MACTTCRASGFVARRVKREVQIPAGIDDQMRVRLPGEGEPSPNGGPRGDCYCFISIKEHNLFQRTGYIQHQNTCAASRGAVVGNSDQEGAVAQACLQGANHAAIVGKGIQVQLQRAQAPVVVVVPFGVVDNEARPGALRRLEVLGPNEHPFVPMNRGTGHVLVISYFVLSFSRIF